MFMRRTTALVSQIENLRIRLEKLMADSEPKDQKSTAKKPKRGDGRAKNAGPRRRARRGDGPSCVGKTVKFQGVAAKVIHCSLEKGAILQLKKSGIIKGKKKSKGAKVRISPSTVWRLVA
jgi:hypothetical protein